jgi:hypothetical protein
MITKHVTASGNTADRIEMDALLRIIEKGLSMKSGTYGAIFVPKGGTYALLFAPKASSGVASSPGTTLSASGRALLEALNKASSATLAAKADVLARNLRAGTITKSDHDLIARAIRLADSAASDAIILDGLEPPKRQRKSA